MGVNMQDILSDLFNMSFGGGKSQQTKSRGDDVEVKSITLINVMQILTKISY